ncbi:DNA primase [Schaalia sp. ZJ405]|uniref:DNA primase n=1 Tax=unclassified Schaalia TaxID=2691889 RepID=UPI0013ED7DE1|nr:MULTISPECIES: DNA primase [unclassified Schaalia]QPK82066.1 DNA primase [Schaalia sp. ZJ405]
MAMDPRTALDRLISAFEGHLAIASQGENADPEELARVEDILSDAFFMYDDVLFTRFDAELPFDIVDEDEDAEVDFVDLDDEDLDDEDVEFIDVDD